MFELWQYKGLRNNLIVITFCWASCSFGYYMLAFVLKYLHGNIFLNAYSSGAGEILGKLSNIPILRCTDLKRVFLIAFGSATMGTMLLLIFKQSDSLTPFLLILAKFGFSQAFPASYLSIMFIYPTILAGTAMGVCVTVAKIVSVMAPMVAEVHSPLNLIILMTLGAITTVISQFLVLRPQGNTDSKQK